jgi:hypothetical protein
MSMPGRVATIERAFSNFVLSSLIFVASLAGLFSKLEWKRKQKFLEIFLVHIKPEKSE